jgi:putative ATP-binding cassette transporter
LKFAQITTSSASVKRLVTFDDVITPGHETLPEIESGEAPRFAFSNLTVVTPNRKGILIRNLTMNLPKEENLVIVGPSGVGKSSLLRVIAGLWTQGSGEVHRPSLAETFFLPQRPYILLGSLRDQLLYPRNQRNIAEAELRGILNTVNLADLPERAGGFDVELNWEDVLSLGEQQRLAFSRYWSAGPALPCWTKPQAPSTPKTKKTSTADFKRWGFITPVWGTGAAS